MTKLSIVLPWAMALAGSGLVAGDLSFQRLHLTDEFWGEGADVADFNHDGHNDVVCGPFWYPGPRFTERHAYMPAETTFKTKAADGSEVTIPGYEGALGTKNAYSNCFFCFTDDFNGDGWADVFVLGLPGERAFWYENPQGRPGDWPKHLAVEVPDGESPEFRDVTGDGKRELVICANGFYGYSVPNWSHPAEPWTFVPVSPKKSYHKYSHGQGAGDVNGDGRMDLIESEGWYEQPASLAGDPVWEFHPYPFCPPTDKGIAIGGAQMFAYDVNGDGLNDIITCIACHGYGLAWYEQVRDGDKIDFKRHLFVNKTPAENPYGVAFSQPHALDLVDIDGDGLKDLITGKRFWAHGPQGDVEANAPAVLYWFKLTRGPNGAEFVPHLIDNDSGVGTQVVATDIDGDKRPDIVVGNKKGLNVFLQRR
ncbi:MAG: VCBS repeat-containing protein [Verrucomicrobiales bacterium]|nr:VCBS repeat-containing protein [Verrucomicrobiales bacterium]